MTITIPYGSKLIIMYSSEHIIYLKKKRKKKRKIIFFQFLVIITILLIWQLLSDFNLINTFLYSSPKNIINTLINLSNNYLFKHIYTTLYEVIISFLIASIIGLIIASLLWYYEILAKILDPYLTIFNSLPKVALGPLIIIWVGASIKSIIFMALMISLIISIINMYNSFVETEESYIILLKSLNASKIQIFKKVILPANKKNIFNNLKINISMSLIGVVMGELLVSKEGLGYLIMYGSQVFNINLVMSSVFVLGILSYLIYFVLQKFEKVFIKEK